MTSEPRNPAPDPSTPPTSSMAFSVPSATTPASGAAAAAQRTPRGEQAAERRHTERPPATGPARVSVAVLGSGESAAALIRALGSLDAVDLAAVWTPRFDTASGYAATEVGARIETDVAAAARAAEVDLVVDASGDERMHAAVATLLPESVELVGRPAVRLLARVLARAGADERRVFEELRSTLDRVRGQERRIVASKEAVERANESLERELAETYFMHEFFRQLTAYTDPDDVCSLVVDGANGMFGAEVSAVYLLDRRDNTLRLNAYQGRADDAFRPLVPADQTLLARAIQQGVVSQTALKPGAPDAAWFRGGAVLTQAAARLSVADTVHAVLVLAWTGDERAFGQIEVSRLEAMADQAALALQNAMLHGELERLSVTDRLTGLYNRGYFEQRMEAEASRAKRYGHDLSLIMLDLDDFKSFNDTYGHPAGDELLRAASAVISGNLREMDVAARYGGEEFVVVLPETDILGALAVADRMREQLGAAFVQVAEGETASRTASLGVAAWPDDADDAPSLVKAADDAMYRAKREGKNRVEAAGVNNDAPDDG